MTFRRPVPTGVVLLCGLLLVLPAACNGDDGNERPPDAADPADPAPPAAGQPDTGEGEGATGEGEPETVEEGEAEDAGEPIAEPLRRTAVEIYFPSAQGNGLVGEFREIFDTATPGDRAKQIIADLIAGPSSDDAVRAIPPGTRLRQVYVLAGGTAYLDFTNELAEGVGGGSMWELLTVYSIVDSVALGVKEIDRVALLINGQPLETLNGHMDLRRPLPPDFKLILGSITVEDRRPPRGELVSQNRR